MTPIPTVNVNLDRTCYCERIGIGAEPHHVATCPAKPVDIPCPIRRSATFSVPGRYICDCRGREASAHLPRCPRETIRVSCSISGETWKESEVVDVELAVNHRPTHEEWTSKMETSALAACRARWALVKALVTGERYALANRPGSESVAVVYRLFAQRDAVFAALEEQARLEQAAFEAQERATKALGEPTFLPDNFHRSEPERRPAAGLLEHYVECLIEQVGIIQGGQLHVER